MEQRPQREEDIARGTPSVAEHGLVVRLRSGEPAAFEELVRELGPRMHAVARRILSVESDAEDVVQEAFLAAFKSLDRFEGESSLATWLHRITVNCALMRIRRRERRCEQPLDELLPRFLECGVFAESPRAWAELPTDRLEQRDLYEFVRARIAQLPGLYREALVLRDLEGMDSAGIARELGTTVNAVRIRIHRARQALRTLVRERCEVEK